jgi:5'-nucleotidase
MLGLEVLLPEAELVLTGINDGPNMGCDVFYSGTIGAAREGYFENRRSIAVSLDLRRAPGEKDEGRKACYETALQSVEIVVAELDLFFGEQQAALLNMNVPNIPFSEVKGFRATFTGRRRYQNRVGTTEGRKEERCFWVQGSPSDRDEFEGSDVRAVAEGYVALTFLQHDTTDYALNSRLDAQTLEKIRRF